MPPDATRALMWLIFVSALLRVAFAGAVGLSVDESYTVAIARHWALSYYDHPPLHVWLAAAWAHLAGSERPLIVRVPNIVMFAVSTAILYRLTAAVYGARAGLWAAVAFNLAPVFTLNAAGGVLPDGPLVLATLLAVWCFWHAVRAPAPDAIGRASMLGAGAAGGLALLSKYTAVFPLLAFAAYLPATRPRWLAEPTTWIAALVAVALFTPVIVWNHAHGWASFAFQGGRASPAGLSVARAALDFAGQLLYLFPWIAAVLLWALVRALRRGPGDASGWLFAVLAAPAIALFTLLGFWAKVLPHWPAIGWLFTFPLAGPLLVEIEARAPRLLHRITIGTALLLVGLVSLVALQTTTGALGRLVPALAAHDPTLDLLDWRALADAAARLQLRQRAMVIATVSWIDAGKSDYALGGRIPVLCLSSDPREFALLWPPRGFIGRDALIVADADRKDWLSRAAPYFRQIDPSEDVVVTRAGRPALTLHTAYGRGLKPVPGPGR
jgi:4-amino-4-deoxy-L-arabinose transferase-like glycosyltransferase